MTKQAALKMTKRKSLHAVPFLLGLLLLAHPAQAQVITVSPLDTIWNQMIGAMHDGISMASESVKTMVTTMLQDKQALNNRADLDAKKNMDIGVKGMLSTGHDSCQIARAASARADADLASGAVHRALSTGGAAVVGGLATDSAIQKTRRTNGFAPCSGGGAPAGGSGVDAETAINNAQGCTVQFGGRWARKDTVMSSLIGDSPYELPIPPNFPLPKNGVPEQVPTVTDEKYMPFSAAYSYCQNINVHISAPLQATSGKVPVDVGSMGAYVSGESRATNAYDSCMDLLTERISYGSNADAGYAKLHTDQITQCDADAKLGIIDSTANSACQTDGRSTLQAEYDHANRVQAKGYHGIYCAGLSEAEIKLDMANAATEMATLKNRIKGERQALTEAIKDAQDAAREMPSFNPLSQSPGS